jgi:hypothetical protein
VQREREVVLLLDHIYGCLGVARSLWCARRIRGDAGEHPERVVRRGFCHRPVVSHIAVVIFEGRPCALHTLGIVNRNNGAHDGDVGCTSLCVLDGLVLEAAMSGLLH